MTSRASHMSNPIKMLFRIIKLVHANSVDSSSSHNNDSVELRGESVNKDEQDYACSVSSSDNRPSPIGIMPLSLWIEKKEGKGEDADPIVFVGKNRALVGVFDGMGGAGAALYKEGQIERSGAQIAADLVRDLVSNFFAYFVNGKRTVELEKPSEIVLELQSILVERLQFDASQRGNPSRLRSSLIRQLPTTLAIIYLEYYEKRYTCYPMWAGDSRCYLLHNRNGLQQISVDDLKNRGDALENLVTDSPLSNYVNADVDFLLHWEAINVEVPFAIIAATDGCFQYVHTPPHFEYILLDTLKHSCSVENWTELLSKRLEIISGDDVSLALVAVGWESFSKLKSDFEERRLYLEKEFIAPYEEMYKQLEMLIETREQISSQIGNFKALVEGKRHILWDKYKPLYEYYLNSTATSDK